MCLFQISDGIFSSTLYNIDLRKERFKWHCKGSGPVIDIYQY